MDFTPEEQEIIKKRRDALSPIYGAEMDAVTDADILALTDEVYEQMLKKNEPQPVTKADLEALYGVIDRQGKALDAFAERIKAQDQAIGAVNQNIEQVAQAVTPLMQAFAEFNKTDAAAPPGAVVQHNGNGGKMDIMSLLQNPLVQKFLGAGGAEQVNPLQAVLSQVQFVAELKQNLDSIGGRGGGINHPKGGNWDRSDFLEGMRWAWRMKNGKMPAELLNAISEDNDDYGSPPRVIVIEKPAADAVRNRRESDGEHKI
jgi:hypothetical protein